jgi:phosphoenolpyruvate synthase/pyruvate phosphate dikinase
MTCLPEAGGKGANLGELTKAGFPVPPGFCVTTDAFRQFIGQSDEMNAHFDLLERLGPGDLAGIRAAGERIRAHLLRLPVPVMLTEAILEAWHRLGSHHAVAVRSSATAEDLPGASFAGQQETFLNVRGEQALLEAIRRCWASLFTDRAIAYRAKNGFDHRAVQIAVVVQRMVFPEVSGILFTADPVTGNRRVVTIDASFGLGEALVSGLVQADLYKVRDGRIVHKDIAKKTIAVVADPSGGTIQRELPPERQRTQALPDDKILELAALGRNVERHYGCEQDIEWCLSEGQFYILQSRPVTTLYPVPRVAGDGLRVFVSLGHQQMMTDALTPLGISVLRTAFPFAKGGVLHMESPAVVEAGGHLFFDPTDLLRVSPFRRVLPRLFSHIDERIGSAVREVVSRPEFQQPPDPRVKKAVRRFLREAVKTLLPRLRFRDVRRVREDIERFIEEKVQFSERRLSSVSGAERIRAVQDDVGRLIPATVRNIGPYVFLGVASSLLTQALVRKWLGRPDLAAALNKSLPGNVTSEMGLQIGDLADLARPHPALITCLERARDDTFWEELSALPEAGPFRDALAAFMARYGMRCPGEIDIARPRWRETPTALVPAILSQVRTLSEGEHRRRFAQGEAEAEAAAREVLRLIRASRGGVWKAPVLRRLLIIYRGFAGLREHPKYILMRHFDLYRRAVLEEGRRLVARGVLDEAGDVFWFSLSELVSVLDGTFPGDIRATVEERKRQHAFNQALTPPRVMTSEGEVVTGVRADLELPEGALQGTPVSAGVAEGYARIVRRPEDAQLQPGDVLVAPFTDPGWTPLFHAATALVMEVGGMMTHGAVVAREYGIPAVVGVDRAMELIPDGAYIRVDGTRGCVQILRRPEGSMPELRHPVP